MDRWSLEFEAADYAFALWWVLGAVLLVSATRYVHLARGGASRIRRLFVVAFLLGTAGITYAADLWRADASFHGLACLAFAVVAATWLIAAYRQTYRPIARRARLMLLACRLIALTVAVVILANPVCISTVVSYERSVLALAVDTSRSMTIQDEQVTGAAARVSRIEAVQQRLRDYQQDIIALSETIDVTPFVFDADIDTPSWGALLECEADGDFTSLTDSMARITRRLEEAGRNVANVVVISDGRDNSSVESDITSVGDNWRDAGIACFAIGVGSSEPSGGSRFLQLRRVDSPSRVSAGNRLPVVAEVYSAGLTGSVVRATLRYDDKVVAHKKWTVAEAHNLYRIELSHVPESPGMHQVAVDVETDSLDSPPSLSRFVQVVEDRLRVLYIDRARHERAVIARALESVPTLLVTKQSLDRPAYAGVDVTLPRTIDEWLAYRVILIGDVDRRNIPMAALRSIRTLVTDHGRGVALIGGVRTLGSGAYSDSEMDDLLGIDLSVAGQHPSPLPFRLTSAGKVHPVCMLGAHVWDRLPDFAGASQIRVTAPTAQTLIESQQGDPLLVVQERQSARTAVVAFDSTWQWSFAIDEGADAQKRFWRQLVFWLAGQDAKVWVSSDQPVYHHAKLASGDRPIVLTAGVESVSNGDAREIQLVGELVDSLGHKTAIKWAQNGRQAEARLALTAPGLYRVSVTAVAGDSAIGQAETAFVIESRDLELTNPLPDHTALAGLADATASVGGRFLKLDQFEALIEHLKKTQQPLEVVETKRAYIVDDQPWFWFAVFVAALTLEWGIRRRVGLI